jgi:hypothetical protein
MVEGVPVLGVDPIADYTPVLEQAGLTIDVSKRHRDGPTASIRRSANSSAPAARATARWASAPPPALSEAMLTVAVRPYPRRVHIVARRPD